MLQTSQIRPSTGEENRPVLALFGAIDRFNYGDLLFPFVLESLIEQRIKKDTRRLIEDADHGYLCFQCNRYIGLPKLKQIARQLDLLSRDTGMRVVLLPLGLVPGHSDHVALKRLRSLLESDAVLPTKTTIFDLVALLAHARLFIGTSLHGLITAMSYGVPYVGVQKAAKVAAFLETWCSQPFRDVAGFPDMREVAQERMKGHDAQLLEDAETLKRKAHTAFQHLYHALPNGGSNRTDDV